MAYFILVVLWLTFLFVLKGRYGVDLDPDSPEYRGEYHASLKKLTVSLIVGGFIFAILCFTVISMNIF